MWTGNWRLRWRGFIGCSAGIHRLFIFIYLTIECPAIQDVESNRVCNKSDHGFRTLLRRKKLRAWKFGRTTTQSEGNAAGTSKGDSFRNGGGFHWQMVGLSFKIVGARKFLTHTRRFVALIAMKCCPLAHDCWTKSVCSGVDKREKVTMNIFPLPFYTDNGYWLRNCMIDTANISHMVNTRGYFLAVAPIKEEV